MSWKLVTDSGSDIRSLELNKPFTDFQYVPLIISIDDDSFIDDESINVELLIDRMEESKNPTGTACPSPQAYADTFRGNDNVICFTLTKELSGSYNSARLAREQILEENPEVNIYICNSKTAGSEQNLLIRKSAQLIEAGLSFDEVCKQLESYHENTNTNFILESVDNLVKNGRVNRFFATMIGLLSIRIIGKRTDYGTIELASKSKGNKRTLRATLEAMEENGYKGGYTEISHALNSGFAESLKQYILNKYPSANIYILPMSGLCSFYAQRKGLIVGYETH